MKTAFHISLPCLDLDITKEFYVNTIGAELGRFRENWIDINFFGNQITFIKAEKFDFNNPNYIFEGKILPSFHFGVIIDVNIWGEIYSKLNCLKIDLVSQTTFLKEKRGEHLSYFVKDPNGYLLEFKSFKNEKDIFKQF